MKKIFAIYILFVMLICVVSAETLIMGTIYNSEYSETIEGANITINCNGNLINTKSIEEGSYSGQYTEEQCNSESDLSVYACHVDYGCSQDGAGIKDNLAIVNLSLNFAEDSFLVPEFGVIIAGLTIIGALGTFFVIRRK